MTFLLHHFLFLMIGFVSADDAVDYQSQVRHVFQARCFACHGALKQESGLRIDTASAAISGGDSGPAIVAGNAAASDLFRRISASDLAERMPPEGEALKPDEIDAIRRWINEGAKAPEDEVPESDPRDHWAFRPPVRAAVPQVTDAAWNANPIDAFIAASHERHGLIPQPPADRRMWLRRVSFDLAGLPPTLDEQSAFLNDTSPDACNNVVARLLGSPQYGERWGRHWMDIWRYSDWWGLGAEVRNSQKHIWHWRDWIIESINSDKAYDQMLREMLAADELYPHDPDRLRASGFLARQYFKFNRTSWMDETIQHTCKALLGITFNCAKCHDHKYDPISHVNYYQMRAFFEPYQVRTDILNGELDFEKDGLPRAFDCNLDTPTYLHIRGDDRNPDTAHVMHPEIPEFLASGGFSIEPVVLPAEAWNPGLRQDVIDAHLKAAEREIETASKTLIAAKEKLTASQESAKLATSLPESVHLHEPASGKSEDKLLPVDQASLVVKIAESTLEKHEAAPASIRARSAADRAIAENSDTPESHDFVAAAAKAERIVAAAIAAENVYSAELNLLRAIDEKRAEAETKLADARKSLEAARAAIDMPENSYTSLKGSLKTLESNLETEESRSKPFPKTSTGRRTALAKWMTHRDNPLTARVAVNHIWARHFGTPLVPTVFDFGRKGIPPTHPDLLDWLAVELMESGWSMKHIHQLIVTSNTYRLTSTRSGAADVNENTDGDNRWYWRTNPIRMEAQLVRDGLLHLAGDLDLTLGGPSIPVNDEMSRRRSLYYVHSHNEHQKFLSMFDDASVLECYRRADSIVPQQALALENSELASALASKIAAQVSGMPDIDTEDAFVKAAFQTILSVDANEQEVAASVAAMQEFQSLSDAPDSTDEVHKSRIMLIHALINHNDFVTIR